MLLKGSRDFVETLLDPGFVYPDLVAAAERMVAGTISIKDGVALARKVTAGEVRQTSVGRARVIGPQNGASQVLAHLQAYSKAHDQRTSERWAAFLLMIEAQLGIGDRDSDAAHLGLANALTALEPCVKATGARCPPDAARFAVQAVASVLQSPACTDPSLRAHLTAARASFNACARASGIDE